MMHSVPDLCIRKKINTVLAGTVRVILTLVVLANLSFLANAQKPNLKFTALTTRQGLMGNAVNAIVKDNNGMMWVGTSESLNRYDGRKFKVYTLGAKRQVEPGSYEISSISMDRAGTLWVGTIGFGLYYYDKAADDFKSFSSPLKGQRLSQGVITAVCANDKNEIWVGTVNGLDVISPDRKYISHFETGTGKPGQIPVKSMGCIFEDSYSRIWICTNLGLYLYDDTHKGFKAFRHQKNDTRSLPSDVVMTVSQDKAGNLWVGTANGLSRLDKDGEHFVNYCYNDKDETSLCGDIVYSIAADDKDHIWVGTEGGLNVMDIHTGKSIRYRHDPRDPYSLNSKSIRSIYIDPKGIYWVGTYMGGINKYDKNLTLFNYVQPTELDPYGLRAPIVSSFAQKNDNELYVGTDGGGLSIFNNKTNRFTHIAIQPKEKINSAGLPVLAMLLDHKKQLWIGTFGHGLFKLNTANNSYTQFTGGSGKLNISQNNIFCFKEDRSGNVWIGTNGAGIDIFDAKADSFRRFKPALVSVKGYKMPSNGYIRAFEEDNDGNMWIGSYGTGIAIYNPATKVFDTLNPINTGLPIAEVLSLKRDTNGNMWIGTNGDGLFFYDHRLKKITPFKYNSQLPNGVICKILQDKTNNIWFSTNQGIGRIDPADQKLYVYCNDNGLQNNVFLNGSGIIAADGTLYFGGVDGFNYFKGSDVRLNKNLPPVVLTTLSIDNKRISPNRDNPLPVNISEAKEITIKYKQDISINFVALNYTLPQQNRYSYILEGFSNTWKNAGTSTTASYTNLDPGEYTFRVRASNNDGKWNDTGTSLKIIVKPPFWMTIYAYVLYVLLAFGVLLLIRRQGVKKLKKKLHDEQERKAAEARHELDEMKIKFLTNLSHEFRTPISLIMAPVDKLLEQPNSGPVTEQLGVIKRNSRRLLNLVNQLLDFRKLEENELKLNLVEGEFISFVREVADSFYDLANRKKIVTVFKTAGERLFVKFDHDKVERILFNLLSNAFKFTMPGGQITVEVTAPVISEDGNSYRLGISVADTGTGIATEQVKHVFDRFYQADAQPAILNQGSGIGLSITRELVQLHGGEIGVKSELGKGSIFSLSISLPVINLSETAMHEQNTPEAAPVIIDDDRDNKPKTAIATGVNRLHVLVIEDNDEMRQYLSESLAATYKVSEAANGREGWHKALAVHPDLIVSDISMPYMDGIQLSCKLRADKRTSHIPIILLTAMASQKEQLAGLELGVNDYLTKPFNFDILNIKIKNLLHLNKSLKETYQKKIKVIPADMDIESSSERFIKDVVMYIEKNINNPKFSVEEISHHFSMSRGSFYSKITELTGEPPVEFIRSIKLDKAAILLEKTDLTIAEIAYSIGFSTPHYFTKSFKAKYNVLPSEYRVKKIDVKSVA
ncbi:MULTISPECIES: hybrid sensor histidine kinase/response regulator transcription factor [Mucilaginibacter]|uniref:hybrid sensor histidine kinase/response regulator transcription factor n=1 Tax=Mucilaginibacter TaxID=423349 RepID=UPI00087171C1|nr:MULTISPECIES: hybrid sensor histidine kinase/response regulator transcription factor [Mucilaginibacter]GGA98830.1 hybrid sensor histidine kinase/response regulator [Mucilaginibacter rubeus]SCW51171.1 Signal transduction histidine kinase [Mucilaginibacter sp. NFR10]